MHRHFITGLKRLLSPDELSFDPQVLKEQVGSKNINQRVSALEKKHRNQ